ncbi:twin transmembrane helix small protein [Xanthobacter sediminis]|uniref:twin transmembrane helix small protein n=1 Tax=Xanthobacter sediminis TaxID=3119926 RepID=UPI00372619A1
MLHWSIYVFIPLALAAVAGVLLLGLANLASGGSPRRAQKLMRLRVLAQLIAVALVAATVFAMRH